MMRHLCLAVSFLFSQSHDPYARHSKPRTSFFRSNHTTMALLLKRRKPLSKLFLPFKMSFFRCCIDGDMPRNRRRTFVMPEEDLTGISRAKMRSVQQTVVIILTYVASSTPFIFAQLWAVWGSPSRAVCKLAKYLDLPGNRQNNIGL